VTKGARAGGAPAGVNTAASHQGKPSGVTEEFVDATEGAPASLGAVAEAGVLGAVGGANGGAANCGPNGAAAAAAVCAGSIQSSGYGDHCAPSGALASSLAAADHGL
jgi:hypothetical protein